MSFYFQKKKKNKKVQILVIEIQVSFNSVTPKGRKSSKINKLPVTPNCEFSFQLNTLNVREESHFTLSY